MRHMARVLAIASVGLLAVAPGAAAVPTAVYSELGVAGRVLAVSPDGGWVAVSEDTGGHGGTSRVTFVRSDGTQARTLSHVFTRFRQNTEDPLVLLADDGSATVTARDGAYFVPAGADEVRRYGFRWVEARLAGDVAIGVDARVAAFVGRPAAPLRAIGVGGRVLVSADGRRAVVAPERDVRVFATVTVGGAVRRVRTGAVFRSLGFDAALRRVVAVAPDRRSVRVLAVRGGRLVEVARRSSASLLWNAVISPDGRWIATARAAGAERFRYHVGRFDGPLRTKPLWRRGRASGFGSLVVADGGVALFGVSKGMHLEDRARSLDTSRNETFAPGCAGREVRVLGAGVFTCFARDALDVQDPDPIEVQFPSGIIALRPPGLEAGPRALASADGRTVVFAASQVGGGASTLWVARISP